MCDILRGNGFLGEPWSNHPTNDVKVIFCNPDLLWKNELEGPRLGQGGFRKAWEGVWSVGYSVVVLSPHLPRANLFGQHVKMGQRDPEIIQFGKPTSETYSFAAEMLQGVSNELGVELRVGSSGDVGRLGRSSSNMYVRCKVQPLAALTG